jgi:hypothetical protein
MIDKYLVEYTSHLWLWCNKRFQKLYVILAIKPHSNVTHTKARLRSQSDVLSRRVY